jgi:hypothetical protein
MDDDHGGSYGQKLSNADFRRLFETPRRVPEDGRSHRGDSQRPAHKKKHHRPKLDEPEEKKEEIPGYR